MKKVWLTALLSLFPAVAGAEVYTLPGVVVTAENGKETKDTVFLPHETLTEKDMERMGASNVVEALSTALGVDLSSGSQDSRTVMGSNQLMIRGMNSSQPLVLVDGHRLADEDTASSQNMNLLQRFDLSQVEQIDIIRGADGVSYGSSAMGGVVNIRTKKPGSSESSAGFRLGEGENTLYFHEDAKGKGPFYLAVSGRVTRVRPLSFRRDSLSRNIHYDGFDVPSYGIRRYAGLDGLYDFRNGSTLRLKADYFDEDTSMRFSDASMNVYGSPVVLQHVVLQQDEKSRTERTQWNTSLTYEGKTAGNVYSGEVYYSRLKKYSETWNDRPDFRELLQGFPTAMVPGLDKMVQGLDKLDNLFKKWDYDRAFYEIWGISGKDTITRGSHSLTFGSEWNRSTYTGTRLSRETYSGTGNKDEEGHGQTNGAFYVSDTWHVNSRLTFLPSVRLERDSSFGFLGVPAAGLSYRFNDRMTWKTSYGKGFRAPSISERYIHLDHMGGTVDGNPDLKAETSRSFDTGLEWKDGKTAWTISWFDQKVKNLIDYEEMAGSSMEYRYVNRKQAELKGLEGEISYALLPRWTVRGTYTYLDGRDRSENTRLPNRSRHTAMVALSYDSKAPYGLSGMIWPPSKGISTSMTGTTHGMK
ncbi:TonB-dependent siderophore receptor [uncultured Dialister sp.]|uniref:TonB-dependent receptor plug domain-containing protein n=1 Tax=uncultured Dialister sp. TaxID=278064 RepID=UPI0025986270|nr:TonB-dependent receptor [uncultured Dialister sp.]